MSNDPGGTTFSIGDSVVGPPAVSLLGNVQWIPEPSGFDAMCRVKGPVGAFLKSRSEMVRDLAQALAPVDTGVLRDSIEIQYGKWEDGIYSEVGTDVYYAVFQEYGTVNHDAHPFLRPALMSVMQDTLGTHEWGSDTAGWAGEAFSQEGRFDWNPQTREWMEI